MNKQQATHEMQGPVSVPDTIEDEIFVRNPAGQLVKLEVADDVEHDQTGE